MHWFIVIGAYLLFSLICWLGEDSIAAAVRRWARARREDYRVMDDRPPYGDWYVEFDPEEEYELERTYYDSSEAKQQLRDHKS